MNEDKQSADLAGEARPGDAPKPLDDPRLQELFMSAITGAISMGAQGINRPPVGHWLCAAWNMGAETARAAAPAPVAQALTDEQILARGPAGITKHSYLRGWRDCEARHG